MKTEILFRAKVAGTDGWIEGLPYQVYLGGIDSIQDLENKQVEYIKTDTLGQFTSHTDINDKQIFEHDICKMIWKDGTIRVDKIIKKVDFFAPSYASQPISTLIGIGITFEVVGNIFDDPELIIECDE